MRLWYWATTKHQQEMLAAAQLRNQEYIVYVPKVYWREPSGFLQCAIRYPGYVFIYFDADLQEHGPINNTRGIEELMVDLQGRPRPVPNNRTLLEVFPHGLIEAIRQMEDQEFAEAMPRKTTPREDLRVGEKVIIAMNGHIAIGERGEILRREKDICHVLVGSWMVYPIPDAELRKLETEKKPVREKKPKKSRRKAA